MRIDLTDKIFGKITVLKFHHQKMPCYSLYWECICECGKICIINGHSLKTGLQTSCGCGRDKTKFKKTHGKIHTYEYVCWMGMKARCKNLDGKKPSYKRKNIQVCNKWLNSFETFLEDMGEAPTKKHTVERIDNFGNYCKENCRWATRKEQNRNFERNKLLTYNGETLCQADWTERLGFKENTIGNRLRSGWSLEKAITTPVRKRSTKKPPQSA